MSELKPCPCITRAEADALRAEIAELKKQIETMRCCGNCGNYKATYGNDECNSESRHEEMKQKYDGKIYRYTCGDEGNICNHWTQAKR